LPQKLGQHFLIKASILERIAAAVCPAREDLVIEIGPGRGALTEKLLKRSERVIAIEVDPYLADHLRQKYSGEPRLEIVQADVLETDIRRWGRAAVAGNLPYYITSPILAKTLRSPFKRAVFLVQKEVAERIAAAPGSRDYGFLTVETATFANAGLLFEVKPTAFYPPPKVDSAVVRLEPLPAPLCAEPEAFLRFVRQCFHQKRKTIRNNLGPVYGNAVEGWPEARLRGEQIQPEGFLAMYRRLAPGDCPRSTAGSAG
jgi:16S rRNA (adenine1518-N6/adenine1519-N6)-dimethyltransferase